ncbi:dTDP-4-dehydrorhamnose reductase [Lysobacter claricitrinus]|uniref:dTDP-4-dehydrorhamnose reductase n=1 Tax=Lysobacter claricitrinus TaxID=3367728 RepID=UPI0037DB06BB
MKLLIIGATGQVGRELATALAGDDFVLTTRSGAFDGTVTCLPLDVSNLPDVRHTIDSVGADIVINASAYTAVDRAESEPELAFRVNAEAVGAMAEACRASGARFVHFSTDYVFDGSSRAPYTESAPTRPLGVYGMSKLAGEEAVLASGVDHLILRTAWVYATHGQNFLLTMLRLAADREELRIVDDQRGCPTPARWIAETTAALVQHGARASGIVNVVAAGQTTWCGFANAIFDESLRLGLLDRAPRVVPIPTSGYPTPAQRPAYSVLDTARLRSFGIDPPDWRNGLVAELSRLRDPAAGMR